MCKLTIAQPKGDTICFESDVITPLVLCLKNIFSLRTVLKKFQSKNYLKKNCLATMKRYADDIFFVYNFKA